MTTPTKRAALEAAKANACLYAMETVIGLLEAGAIDGGPEGASITANKIIKLAKKEKRRQLKRYDLARSQIR